MASTKNKKSTKSSVKKPVVEKNSEAHAELMTVHASQVVINGGVMKDKMVPFLVALVVIAAFAVGLLYGKVSVLEKGLVAGTVADNDGAQQLPSNDEALAPDAIPEDIVLSDEMWEEILQDPVTEMGDSNAKVVMVEFTDYECPFCARYFTDTMGQIVSDYVDTGKIRYIARDLPLSFHPNAKSAAIAARCGGEQGKYNEMHDLIFDRQSEWSGGGDSEEIFGEIAAEAGLNAGEFASCYASGKFDDAIESELALASKVGATGTPTFYINGKQIVGAQPYSVFQAELDAALGE